MRSSFFRGMGVYLLLLLLGILVFYWIMHRDVKEVAEYNDTVLVEELKQDLISSVSIFQNKEVPTGYVYVVYNDSKELKYFSSDINKTQIKFNGVPTTKATLFVYDIQRESKVFTILPIIISVAMLLIFVFLLLGRAGGSGASGTNKAIDFGKSRAKMSSDSENKLRFKDVAGLEEEKEELEEIVDFLKNPKKFTKLGARIPKGIMLVGPPGTGKTLIAKAVSGEAGVPFFSISGSDFVEMFVGVGASRVRDLFAEAKKNSPCIVFIDEIDAVARKRGSGLGGGHDEREQTLNQMLVEMDGFATNEGIIVMAATNRADILDPAILRPGRFDRKVTVGKPDVKGREEILKVHVKEKPLGDDVDLYEVARTTAGFAGADLENLMNEAAIRAAREDRAYINKEDVDKSFIKIGIGAEKKSRLIPEKEKRITAFHEAGHAILFHLLSDVGPVHLISIIPNGRGAAGYTMPLPDNDNVFMTKKKMLQDIMVSFGGRIAEELEFEDVTTGAYQDIKQATQYARAMVTRFGMSDKVGYINYETDSEEVFLGRDLGHSREFGEGIAGIIDDEVKRIIDECYKEAKNIIIENYEILKSCAELLLEKERVARSEFEELFVSKYGNVSENTVDSTI